jgi:hypothetical protein
MRTLAVILLSLSLGWAGAETEPAVSFRHEAHQLHIFIGAKPFATYVFQDEQVRRPYLTQVRAPGGVQVTRNHPPLKGKDATDHATMHPGIWLAFGDLGGADFWRNKGMVRHAGFIEKPQAGKGQGKFAVRNRYEAGGQLVCEEVCRIGVWVRPSGYLVVWESAFTGPAAFAFGDQEEMGLGVRLATPLTVKNGGTIINSDGHKNEKGVWGKQADWCGYGGKGAGVLLMPDPGNFRRSWFHARDYGLLVANPFGRHAFTKGEKSRVAVGKGETFLLRFGVFVSGDGGRPKEAYEDFLKVIGAWPVDTPNLPCLSDHAP